MIKKQSDLSALLLIVIAVLFTVSTLTAQSGSVKHIYTIDYPMGKKLNTWSG